MVSPYMTQGMIWVPVIVRREGVKRDESATPETLK